ncbi:MAG TPA: SpoIIE family protein phosphatase [Kineosporiaceae bacterium]|nr:SpoIIE family protein phosphatase [Kineosporiaceae bacterium]
MSWEFPGLDALDDAVVVFAVDPSDQHPDSPTMRIVHLNRAAGTALGVTPEDALTASPAMLDRALSETGDAARILAVAAAGRADSWVSRRRRGWYEQRAVPLTGVTLERFLAGIRDDGAATGTGADARTAQTRHVLVVARELDSLPLGGVEQQGTTRAALLLQISRRLGTTVGEEQVAEAVCDLVCPALGGSHGVLAVVHEDGGVAVLRRSSGGQLGRLTRRTASLSADAPLLAVLRNGGQQLRPPQSAPGRWRLVVPLRAGTLTVGAIAMDLDGDPDRSQTRQEFVEMVAALVAQAVQRARLYDLQLEANLALQHALLPPNLPEVPGIEVAARYRPGSGHEVGGDWYDVVPLRSGWTAFVIGDVQGHDLAAAAMMGQVRSVVRAYLLDEQPPSAVLGSANAFVLSLGTDRLVTACIVLAHPGSRLVTLASAGHPCPGLLTTGAAGELLRIQPGPPLGALEQVIWRERTTLVESGTTVLMYTDGLIERRTRSYADGERSLLKGAAALDHHDVDRLADGVLAVAGIPGSSIQVEDDTAVLLLRWTPQDTTEPGHGVTHVRTLPVTPSSAVIARWYVDDLLQSWGVPEPTREIAVLLANEVVANAVRHAHRTVRLDVTADHAQVRVEVFDDSHREPKLVETSPFATSGRGLSLVDALSSGWGVRTSAGDLGKTVWFTVDLSG